MVRYHQGAKTLNIASVLTSIRNSQIIYRGGNVDSSWNVLVSCQNPLIESICCIEQILKVFNGPLLTDKDILNCFSDGGWAIVFFCSEDQIFPLNYKLQFLFQSAKLKKVFSVFDYLIFVSGLYHREPLTSKKRNHEFTNSRI